MLNIFCEEAKFKWFPLRIELTKSDFGYYLAFPFTTKGFCEAVLFELMEK